MPRLDVSHRSGNHCGSTSLRDLSSYYGWGFDEPTCFGLASGLGFSYQEVPESPERLFFGRSSRLEWAFFEHLEIEYELQEGDPFETAWDDITDRIDDGDPVMIFTDLYYLDYYGTDTHFSPHSLLVVGYDDEHAHLADSEFDEIQTLPLDRLQEALTSDYMTPLQCRYLTVEDPTPGADFETAAKTAIEETAQYMLSPETVESGETIPGKRGVAAIRAFAEDLPSWHRLSDPSWTTRFAYQNVERRGTGGGAFRKMYADFLAEAVEVVAIPENAPDRMADIAADWTALGEVLYEASETDDTDDLRSHLEEAGERAATLADREARLYEDLQAAVADS